MKFKSVQVANDATTTLQDYATEAEAMAAYADFLTTPGQALFWLFDNDAGAWVIQTPQGA